MPSDTKLEERINSFTDEIIHFYKRKLKELVTKYLENTEILVIFLEKEKYEEDTKQSTLLNHMHVMYSFKFSHYKNFYQITKEDVEHVSEHYIAILDPFIVMVSTPIAPDSLFEKIEREPEETCIYKRLKLDYRVGLNKIYKQQEIDNSKSSLSFDREYDLKYLGVVGNVFSQEAIDWSITDEELEAFEFAPKSMGIDPDFGSSAFGICVTQFINGKVDVIFAEEFSRSDYQEMVNLLWEIKEKMGHLSNVYVDASFPDIITTLKREICEADGWRYVKERIDY